MPRRDGFPTNNELQDQLEVAGTQLFVAAYQHELDSKVPNHLKDKPLGHIALTIVEKAVVPEGLSETTAVSYTELYMRPIEQGDAEYGLEEHLRWRGDEVKHDRRIFAAQIIGEAVLTDETHIDDLPPEAIITDFTAHMLNTNRTRHVGTLKEKPTKMSLVAASGAVENAFDYVNSTDFEKAAELRTIDRALFGIRSEYDQFVHRWTIPFRSDLVFNGYESKSYLTKYVQYSQHNIDTYQRMLQRSEGRVVPQSILDYEKWKLAIWQQAKDRALQALENHKS